MNQPNGFKPIPGLDKEGHAAMLALLADLRYPVGPQGEVFMVADVINPIVAYHLARCGWRPHMDKRRIKARRVYGPGVYEDAVHWVGIEEPDDPLANLSRMTIAEIEGLDDELRAEAKRRLGMPPEGPARQASGWHTRTNVTITDAPEPELGADEEQQP